MSSVSVCDNTSFRRLVEEEAWSKIVSVTEEIAETTVELEEA